MHLLSQVRKKQHNLNKVENQKSSSSERKKNRTDRSDKKRKRTDASDFKTKSRENFRDKKIKEKFLLANIAKEPRANNEEHTKIKHTTNVVTRIVIRL